MSFVGDDDDVTPFGEKWVLLLAVFGRELLDRGKDHAARGAAKFSLQIVATISLNGRLPNQIAAPREGSKKLIVQVVAISDNNYRRILEDKATGQLSSVESHQKALARALRVPDDTNLAIALWRCRLHGLDHGMLYGVKLVISRDDLRETRGRFAEHGKVMD